ncbi:MAG: hypothetical protein IJ794_01695 [Lachnospiraceae bacterium]|nr:hypothetical protein [Lachnospiraceae bacterium]
MGQTDRCRLTEMVQVERQVERHGSRKQNSWHGRRERNCRDRAAGAER